MRLGGTIRRDDGHRGTVAVESFGIRQLVEVTLDRIAQKPKLHVHQGDSAVQNGTLVTLDRKAAAPQIRTIWVGGCERFGRTSAANIGLVPHHGPSSDQGSSGLEMGIIDLKLRKDPGNENLLDQLRR